MIEFVNAKINIGLQIVRRREDGYHDLQTIFYPVGLYAGRAENPVSFCDLLEIDQPESIVSAESECRFELIQSGRRVDCPLGKNLVWRAADLYFNHVTVPDDFRIRIHLEKYLPDGAGMGGGSADAAFTLRMIRDLHRSCVGESACRGYKIPDDSQLAELALKLGADCPFFILNSPAYAEGVGERLEHVTLDLSGYWLAVIKPTISISTKEAFAGITPRPAEFDLREIAKLPIEEWRDHVVNDFEYSIFPKYPEFGRLKDELYCGGALYASLTGSGSCLYGIFDNRDKCELFLRHISENSTICATYLLKL